jgi:hypothetical protein
VRHGLLVPHEPDEDISGDEGTAGFDTTDAGRRLRQVQPGRNVAAHAMMNRLRDFFNVLVVRQEDDRHPWQGLRQPVDVCENLWL